MNMEYDEEMQLISHFVELYAHLPERIGRGEVHRENCVGVLPRQQRT
jgi:hypothetical protein